MNTTGKIGKVFLFVAIAASFICGCEKDPSEEPDKNQEGTYHIAKTRPTLRNESVSSSVLENEYIENHFSNPFKSMVLHNPTALGLVETTSPGSKKSDGEEALYHLYEYASDSFRMVKGQEGNEIMFRNVSRMDRINNSWQIITGKWVNMEGEVILETPEMEIAIEYEIEVDSIYMSDTIPANNQENNSYADLGDTLFIRADTTVFNDTLWIQQLYTYTDTSVVDADTSYTIAQNLYQSLLLNTNSGDLYEVGIPVWNPQSEAECFFQPGFYDYNPENNAVYFAKNYKEIVKIDLNDLRVSITTLPSEPYSFQIDYYTGRWCVLENENILFTNHNGGTTGNSIFCYIPGSGMRTATNWSDETVPFNSMHWRGKDNKRYMCSGYTEHLYTVELSGDTILYTEVPVSFDHHESRYGEPGIAKEFGAAFHKILHNGETWFYDGQMYFTYNEEQKKFKSFSICGEIFNNGFSSYLYSQNSVYRVDFDQMDASYLFTIDSEDLSDPQISLNSNNNFLISGFRLYDLKSVVMEYDGETGEKINEWEEENAPPSTQVYQMSPVFDD